MTRFAPLQLLALLLVPAPLWAVPLDLSADRLDRDENGVMIASGDVRIVRGDETIRAEEVRYDPEKQLLYVRGAVRIDSPQGSIRAEAAELDTGSRNGTIHGVTIELPSGEHLHAARGERLGDGFYRISDVDYSACPSDNEAWSVSAAEAELDQGKGELTVRRMHFDVGPVPLLYSPWWNYPLRRKSGFLLPTYGAGKRRGTELSLPYYFAPADNWDATLTPHWMSNHGLMPQLEWRHRGSGDFEQLRAEAIRDKRGGRGRSRIVLDSQWQLGEHSHLILAGDQVSDRNYLADFSPSLEEAKSRYLASRAELDGNHLSTRWTLAGQYQRNLALDDNSTTLQVAPRLTTLTRLPLLDDRLIVNFEQQSTRFDRKLGVDGWRIDLHPFLQLPFTAPGGAMHVEAQFGSRLTRYGINDPNVARNLNRRSLEGSFESSAIFERIGESRLWRHSIEPTLRYDWVAVGNQQQLPNFDSGFSRVDMGNLLSPNRFSGRDRIERTNRISFLLGSRLQAKDAPQAEARTLLHLRGGFSYDRIATPVDPKATLNSPRHISNLLGELTLSPLVGLDLAFGAQYDPLRKRWMQSSSALEWQQFQAVSLHLDYQQTSRLFANPVRTLNLAGELRPFERWRLGGNWTYDRLLGLSQLASLSATYSHPCWEATLESFRTNLPTGVGRGSVQNAGWRLLIGFKGIGSVGSS